jgi:hypothetical protein
MRCSRHVIGSSLVAVAAVVSACGIGFRNQIPHDLDALRTTQDSVRQTGMRLHALVGAVDRAGRGAGALPATFDDVGGERGVAPADLWGKEFRYSATGNAFEIRSAGRDGAFDSADDIVATGRLGRSIPCEIRDERQTTRWDNVAPRCDAVRIERIYPLCPVLDRADRVERDVPATQADSVRAMGRRLVRVARAVDGFGRQLGTVPPSLRGPVIWDRNRGGELPDLWATLVRYSTEGNRFELRSAGPDRVFDSADDIVVEAVLGSSIVCRFRTEGGEESCSEAPPPC